MRENAQTAKDLVGRIRTADARELAVLKRALASDGRVTVRSALQVAERRVAAQEAEQERLRQIYAYEQELTGGRVTVGLDEVGRGPLAGPLTVAAVVLDGTTLIPGLNDSKQVPAVRRRQIAHQVRQDARAVAVVHVEPDLIDKQGMSACLRQAFAQAVQQVEAQGIAVEALLLDGNPLHLDAREISVIHGDARCASIAAASIVAKVERDEMMTSYARRYPGYGFESNKGYGSAAHQQAIRELGLCPIHRRSFCTGLLQQTLF